MPARAANPTPFGAYLREWRAWRTHIDGRCEAACSTWHDGRHGRCCRFSGAWDGASGRVLCRVHQDRYAEASGDFRFAP